MIHYVIYYLINFSGIPCMQQSVVLFQKIFPVLSNWHEAYIVLYSHVSLMTMTQCLIALLCSTRMKYIFVVLTHRDFWLCYCRMIILILQTWGDTGSALAVNEVPTDVTHQQNTTIICYDLDFSHVSSECIALGDVVENPNLLACISWYQPDIMKETQRMCVENIFFLHSLVQVHHINLLVGLLKASVSLLISVYF